MGRPGPVPKPEAEKRRNGTYREDRHGRQSLQCEMPTMPGGLSPSAQAFWQVVGKEAEKAGYITASDGRMLQMMAESWHLYCEANDYIAEHGIVVEEVTEKAVRTKPNPALSTRKALWKEIYDGLKQFGLSPSSRVGMRSSHGDSTDDEAERIADILGIGRG